jgi:hypothetical protein
LRERDRKQDMDKHSYKGNHMKSSSSSRSLLMGRLCLIFVDQLCPAALLASMLKLIKIVIQVIHRSAWKITSQPVVKAMIRI